MRNNIISAVLFLFIACPYIIITIFTGCYVDGTNWILFLCWIVGYSKNIWNLFDENQKIGEKPKDEE